MSKCIALTRPDVDEAVVINLEAIAIAEPFHPSAGENGLGPVSGTLLTLQSGNQVIVREDIVYVARCLNTVMPVNVVLPQPPVEEVKEAKKEKKNGKSSKTRS